MKHRFDSRNSLMVKALSLMSLVSVLITGIFYFAYCMQTTEFDEQNRAAIESVIAVVRSQVEDISVSGETASTEKFVDQLIKEGVLHGVAVYGEETPIFIYPQNLNLTMEYKSVQANKTFAKNSNVQIRLYLNQQAILKSKDRFALWSKLFIICVLTTLGFIAYYIKSKIVKPLLDLTEKSQLIANGNYDFKIENQTNDEIGELTQSLAVMAVSLQKREEDQKRHASEVAKLHYQDIKAKQNRTEYLDSLINDTAPYLTDALVTLQSLSDRPHQQRLINKVLLFVVAKLEQARALIDEASVPFEINVEKLTLEEFSNLVNEYGAFITQSKNVQIEFKLKCDPHLNTKAVYLLIDKIMLIKLFALFFEVMTPKVVELEQSPTKNVIWLMVDKVDQDVSEIEIMVRSDSNTMSADDCALINMYFSNSECSGAELDELTKQYKANKITFESLKSISDYLRADYSLISLNAGLESRFKCKIYTCRAEETIEERLQRVQTEADRKPTIFVGNSSLISKQLLIKRKVTILSYSQFLNEKIESDTTYIIDYITEQGSANKVIARLVESRLEKNLAVLVENKSLDLDRIDAFYESGVDIVLAGYLDIDNLKKANSEKIRQFNSMAVSGIIDRLS